MAGKSKAISEEKFNYGLLKADLAQFYKDEGITQEKFSTDYLFHSKSFTSHLVNDRTLTPQFAMAICKIIGQPMKRYKVEKPAPDPEPEAAPAENGRAEDDMTQEASAEWGCKIAVNAEFGIVSFALLHNGEVYTKGHARIDGERGVDIAKSISYAAHICYKNIEQKDFCNRIAKDEEDAEYKYYAFGTDVPFKEYIRQFTGEKSARGELARYVFLNYAKFPSWGEKKIRSFLAVERAGKQIIDAFDDCWKQYRDWNKKR